MNKQKLIEWLGKAKDCDEFAIKVYSLDLIHEIQSGTFDDDSLHGMRIRETVQENERLKREINYWEIEAKHFKGTYELYFEKAKVLQKQNKAYKAFYNYFADLYGKGLQIANWHQNGDLQSFESFFDSAEAEMGENE